MQSEPRPLQPPATWKLAPAQRVII